MHRVDKELGPLLQLFPSVQFSLETLAATREKVNQMAALAAATVREDVVLEERHVPATGSAPSVRMLICTPKGCAENHPAILFLHGGGYVTGCPELDLQRLTSWAVACQSTVVRSITDWRLRPLTPAHWRTATQP